PPGAAATSPRTASERGGEHGTARGLHTPVPDHARGGAAGRVGAAGATGGEHGAASTQARTGAVGAVGATGDRSDRAPGAARAAGARERKDRESAGAAYGDHLPPQTGPVGGLRAQALV